MAKETGRSGRHAIAGGALVGLGLTLLVLMMAFPERLNVPAAIGYLVAGTFVVAGLLAIANVYCSRRIRAWLAVALLSCMLLPSVWIAVGSGPRSCSVSLGLQFGVAEGDTCRIAFGVAALVGLLLLLVALRHALKGGADES